MKCPKCGHVQVQSESCGKCGIILSKYDEIQERKRRASRRKDFYNYEPRRKIFIVLFIFCILMGLTGLGVLVAYALLILEESYWFQIGILIIWAAAVILALGSAILLRCPFCGKGGMSVFIAPDRCPNCGIGLTSYD